MFIQLDKTIVNTDYVPEGINGWLVPAELEEKIRSNYPWIDLVVQDGQLVDVQPTQPQEIVTPPTDTDILGQTVAELTLQNMQLNSTVDTLGAIVAQAQLDIMALKGGAAS